MKATTTGVPPCRCPSCKALLDVATTLGPRRPKPNDITVCGFCAVLLVFEEDLSVRLMTPTEIEEFRKADPEGYKQLRAFRSVVEQMAARRRHVN